MNINDIKKMTPKEVAEFCDDNYFNFPIIKHIESTDDLKEASKYMGILMGHYSFLASLLAHLKYMIRDAKVSGNQKEANDLIDKRTTIDLAFNIIKDQYAMISRRITIYEDLADEMKMTDYIKKKK